MEGAAGGPWEQQEQEVEERLGSHDVLWLLAYGDRDQAGGLVGSLRKALQSVYGAAQRALGRKQWAGAGEAPARLSGGGVGAGPFPPVRSCGVAAGAGRGGVRTAGGGGAGGGGQPRANRKAGARPEAGGCGGGDGGTQRRRI